jgi:DNA-binding MarR family transcriptional regulator
MEPRKTTICSNIKFAWHAIARLYNEQGAKYGVTTSVGFVLLNIDREEGIPATKIAPLLGMEAHGLSRILKNLEQDALIYRKQDEHDKRLMKVYLTEKGKEAKELAKNVVRRFNDAVKQEIPENKLEVFNEVMEKINNIILEKKMYP